MTTPVDPGDARPLRPHATLPAPDGLRAQDGEGGTMFMKALSFFVLGVLCLRVARLSDTQGMEPWTFILLGAVFVVAWIACAVRAVREGR